VIMRKSTLEQLGHHIWGKGWTHELARAMGVNPVTVRRWSAGIRTMSAKSHRDMLAAARAHAKARYQRAREIIKNQAKYTPVPKRKPSRLKPRPRTPRDVIPPWKKPAQDHRNLPDF